MNSSNKLIISAPRKVRNALGTRLLSDVSFPGENVPRQLWIEVDDSFADGLSADRLDRIKVISNNHLAQKYLHPCIYIRHNCGHCEKCIRTETALYSIGKLEQFSAVFDVGEFYRNKGWYLSHLLALKENQHCAEVISQLQQRGEKFDRDIIQQARVLNCARKVVAGNRDKIQEMLKREIGVVQ